MSSPILIVGTFAVWPDIRFDQKRLYVTPGLIVFESTAHATQAMPLLIGGETIEPHGRMVAFAVADILAVEAGLVKRKDIYLDALGYVRAMSNCPTQPGSS